jgi:hypothetical protein
MEHAIFEFLSIAAQPISAMAILGVVILFFATSRRHPRAEPLANLGAVQQELRNRSE